MVTYNEYLSNIGIIDEDDFNNIVNSLPEVDDVDFYDYDYDNDSIAESIINAILRKFDYVYIEHCNVLNKTLMLNDVQSIKDLESIKSIFEEYDWKITNYDELLENLKEEEAENKEINEIRHKKLIIESVIDNIPIEDVIKFAEKYGYKK